MVDIEFLFVEKYLDEKKYSKEKLEIIKVIKKYWNTIDELRKNIKKRINLVDLSDENFKYTNESDESDEFDIKTIYKSISDEIKGLLYELIGDCMQIYKIPDEKWYYVFISMGSLSREEATPYSDIEFAILIDDKVDKSIQEAQKLYFDNLTKLIQLRIITIGETSLTNKELLDLKLIEHLEIQKTRKKVENFLEERQKTKCGIPFNKKKLKNIIRDIEYRLYELRNPVPKGISFDGAEKTPLGKGEYNLCRLIGTPDELINLVTDEGRQWHMEDLKLISNMLTVSSIDKNKDGHRLLTEYEEKFWILISQNNFTLEIFEKFKKDLEEFNPHNYKILIEPYFLVKQDLYRLPDRIIANLAMLYKIKENNIFARIAKLKEKGIIPNNAAINLYKTLRIIMYLRAKVYLHYKSQREDIYLTSTQLLDNFVMDERVDIYYLNDKEKDKLSFSYLVITALYEQAYEFMDDNNKLTFSAEKTVFTRKDLICQLPHLQGKNYKRRYMFFKAKQAYELPYQLYKSALYTTKIFVKM